MENSSGKKELATWILTATSKFMQLTISAASGNCVSLLENTPVLWNETGCLFSGKILQNIKKSFHKK